MKSIWSKSCEIPKRKALDSDLQIEIAVIGAGMAGILIAKKLQETGHDVVVLEADRIAGGQTKNTTAKITAQHGLIYSTLYDDLGSDMAKQYAKLNMRAIKEFESIIEKEKIDCAFEKKDAYLYSVSDDNNLEEEFEVCRELGLDVELTDRVSLPFDVCGAVKMRNQAQFNPLQFLKSVSEKLNIYEKTPVIKVEDNTVFTEKYRVTADKIVFACHFPFLNFPGYYFARMYQERSYVIALENAELPDGMFIGDSENPLSLRTYNGLLLLGGAGHRTGENSLGGNYDKLREAARKYYPNSREVACWSAQDCITLDSVPYIGVFAQDKPDWYVATGFMKWGMTTSMVSAIVISDMINKAYMSNAEVFSPQRFNMASVPQLFKNTAQAVKGIAKENLTIPNEDLENLEKGHSGFFETSQGKAGAYKDESGRVFLVDTRCPHLGCQLQWNGDEKTWDCPCHGSRFDYEGKLISNPAQTDIIIK